MKINEFPNYNNPTEDDILLIWDVATNSTKHVKLADLKNIFGSGSTTTPPASNEVNLKYISDGDTNGVFYYIGTNKLTQAWRNPHTDGLIEVKQSSAFNSSYQNPPFLTDRQNSDFFCTNNSANSWFSIDLKANKNLVLSAYSIQCRSFNANHPRTWKLQGSNDENAWIDINSQSSISLNSNQWFTQSIVNTPPAYRYFRIFFNGTSSSGDNVFCLGEMELYGKLTYN